MVRFHDKEAEASDFTEKTFYGPIWKRVRDALEEALVNAVLHKNYKEDVPVEIRIYRFKLLIFLDRIIILTWRSSQRGKSGQEDTEILRLENFSRKLICLRRNQRVYRKFCAN